jgi:ParB family chromosome partitioning protein
MRHDSHYVEELAGPRPNPVGRFIPVEQIDPNPEQPRVEFGELEELTASIREKGVLEPLLVKHLKSSGRWMIIAGERRWRAAREAGLREVPCVEMDVDDSSIAEIALIENMQRKDLTPWEEADGLFALCSRYGYTHEDVAKKVGKSRSTVTEALSIAALPEVVREQCRRADINAKSTLLQIVRQPDLPSMLSLVEEISRKGLSRDGARAARRGQGEAVGREKNEGEREKIGRKFRYELPDKTVRLELRFAQGEPVRSEVIRALRGILEALEKETESETELERGEEVI